MAEAEEEAKTEGRHEKVDNGGRIYRTRTTVAHGKQEGERRREEEAGRSHTTYALGRAETHPCMHASLNSVSALKQASWMPSFKDHTTLHWFVGTQPPRVADRVNKSISGGRSPAELSLARAFKAKKRSQP